LLARRQGPLFDDICGLEDPIYLFGWQAGVVPMEFQPQKTKMPGIKAIIRHYRCQRCNNVSFFAAGPITVSRRTLDSLRSERSLWNGVFSNLFVKVRVFCSASVRPH